MKPSTAQMALEALESIALAGMSPSPEMSSEGVDAWHARQAWRFIGIAARALEPLREASKADLADKVEPVAFRQFLHDVHTAAGLVRHGGQSKGLSDRLSDGVALYLAAPKQAEAPGWISADERLPPMYTEVMVYPYPGNDQLTAELRKDGWVYSYYTQGLGYEEERLSSPRTHWMPLPAAPRSEAP